MHIYAMTSSPPARLVQTPAERNRITPMSGAPTARASDRVRIIEERLLSDDWYILKKTTFEYRCRDGRWQRQSRETYDRGNGAVLLLFNVDRATVVLTRQFRFPAYVNGCPDGLLIEACAGLLDARIRQLVSVAKRRRKRDLWCAHRADT